MEIPAPGYLDLATPGTRFRRTALTAFQELLKGRQRRRRGTGADHARHRRDPREEGAAGGRAPRLPGTILADHPDGSWVTAAK
jgi:hypothetical protein